LKHSFRNDPAFKRTVSVFTIHNLVFQMERNWWEVPEDERDNGTGRLPQLKNKTEVKRLNFTLRAIKTADAITAVSENYAREILSKEFGENLDRVLQRRKDKLTGIINGVDYEIYNPVTDPGLAMQYDASSLENTRAHNPALQELFGLPTENVPVMGMVSRITEQKGIELILSVMDHLLRLRTPVQLVMMGEGDESYKRQLARISKKYPGRFSIRSFEQKYETLIYAGSDIYLMPSRFEPCGLGQLISLRYGSIPIVHSVGGLADTIVDYNPSTREGNGFVFSPYNTHQLMGGIVRALENYRHKSSWRILVEKAMSETFSWEFPAKRYQRLYRKILAEKRLKDAAIEMRRRNAALNGNASRVGA